MKRIKTLIQKFRTHKQRLVSVTDGLEIAIQHNSHTDMIETWFNKDGKLVRGKKMIAVDNETHG